MGRLIGRALLLACIALAAPTAMAQQSEDDLRAKALYDEGTRLYEQGRYEEAVKLFKVAYALSRRPLLLYNMAQAMERTGDWDEALEALEDYRLDATDEELPTLDARIAALKERISERDAEQAAANQPVVIEAPRRGPPPLAWALFGTGAVGVGVGSVFTGQALGARSEWTGSCLEAKDGLICPESAADAWTRDNRASLVADIGWVVGVAGVGGGVVLSLGGRSGADDLQLTVGPGRLGIGGRW